MLSEIGKKFRDNMRVSRARVKVFACTQQQGGVNDINISPVPPSFPAPSVLQKRCRVR